MNEWEWQLLEDKTTVEHIMISDVEVRVGDRVRLRPRVGGDILDIALQGQIATLESIEQDYEGKSHLGVVLDEDPGRDLGLLRQPGHRFFFDPSEVEPLSKEQQQPEGRHPEAAHSRRWYWQYLSWRRWLWRGSSATALQKRPASSGACSGFRYTGPGSCLCAARRIRDDHSDRRVSSRAAPGTISVIEPDLDDPSTSLGEGNFLDPHAMNPMNVLRMARAMHGKLKRIVLVGCEPETFGGEEERWD